MWDETQGMLPRVVGTICWKVRAGGFCRMGSNQIRVDDANRVKVCRCMRMKTAYGRAAAATCEVNVDKHTVMVCWCMW